MTPTTGLVSDGCSVLDYLAALGQRMGHALLPDGGRPQDDKVGAGVVDRMRELIQLYGRVTAETMMPIPSAEECEACVSFDKLPQDKSARDFLYIFVGHIPFSFTRKQLLWVLRNAPINDRGDLYKAQIFNIIIIQQRNPTTGQMQPKGCAHVLVRSCDADLCKMHHLIRVYSEGLEKRVNLMGRILPHPTEGIVCEVAQMSVTQDSLRMASEAQEGPGDRGSEDVQQQKHPQPATAAVRRAPVAPAPKSLVKPGANPNAPPFKSRLS